MIWYLISHFILGLPNLLFCRANNSLSAVLDFDLAHIGAPISEYLFYFWDLDGLLPGSSDDPIDSPRNYILKGFPSLEKGVDYPEGFELRNKTEAASSSAAVSSQAAAAATGEYKWKLARAWDNALSDVGAKKPSTIDKAGDIADIWWFSQDLCEAYWFMDTFLEKKSPEKLEELKAESASKLERYLAQWGF